MAEQEGKLVKLQEGFEFTSPKAHYNVVRLLGSGGFGAVYLIKNDKGNQCAMKVEKKVEKKPIPNLTMEVYILGLLGGKHHFANLIEHGQLAKDGSFFVVMDLVGKSLCDLKEKRKNNVFSFGTGLGVASQCLEAVEKLHKNGFIHRDLKPSNYACGLDDKKNVIYILDFGIARKFVDEKGNMKPPRGKRPVFKGTLRFGSLACHNFVDQAPKDDCESWFYLLLDLILPGGLPWNGVPDRNQVFRWKKECRQEERKALFRGLTNACDLNRIFDHIVSRQYYNVIDYQFIYKALAKACNSAGLEIDAPYDWENSKENTNKESFCPK